MEDRNLERVVGHHRTRYDRAIDPYLVDFIVLHRSGLEVGKLADALGIELINDWTLDVRTYAIQKWCGSYHPEIAGNIRACMT